MSHGTVCWNCGDMATTAYEGQPLCTECFNYLMLEMTSAYSDLEVGDGEGQPEVQLAQEETSEPDQPIPF